LTSRQRGARPDFELRMAKGLSFDANVPIVSSRNPMTRNSRSVAAFI
jgi:hypothetical protein